MKLFHPYLYTWKCHSCQAELVLMVSRSEDLSEPPIYKWVRSQGIRWGREMHVGEILPPIFECNSCLTEYVPPDLLAATCARGRP